MGPRYKGLKDKLIAEGIVTPGRSRGGSVSLVGEVEVPTNRTGRLPCETRTLKWCRSPTMPTASELLPSSQYSALAAAVDYRILF